MVNDEIVSEYDIELHFLIEGTSEKNAVEEFKEIFGRFIWDQADDITISG